MAKAENYSRTINWDYAPAFKTIQISTKRAPAMDANDIIGDSVTHLTGVESSPLILPSQQSWHALREAIGIDGTQIQVWELRMHKSSHIDGGTPVNQLPDIVESDVIVIGSTEYLVRWADITHPFAFGDMLLLFVTEDKF